MNRRKKMWNWIKWFFGFEKVEKKLDVNKDGQVNKADVAAVAAKVEEKLDVNKDGKLNKADVEVVAAKVEQEVKAVVNEVVAKAKTTKARATTKAKSKAKNAK